MTSSLTVTSGMMPASSQASSALSTASFTQVRRALRGLSKPSRCRFFVKNSATEISRWRAPISTAVTCCDGFAGAFVGGANSEAEGMGDLDLESGADAFFFDIHPLKMTTLRLGTTNEVAMQPNKKHSRPVKKCVVIGA